ncbi:MAG TPA: M23 family metallopeptidase, partial [Acidimicrobiales bacterium]|nr:M23 family metallopeptidase [Acidimicrobiales bacterium]
ILAVSASASAGSYTLKWGDTLGKVATRFGLPLQALADANGIANPNKVREGQKLVIPDKEAAQVSAARPITAVAPAPEGGRVHKVRPGEALSIIARDYGTTVAALLELNGLANANRIREGQVLKLPASAAAPPPVVPLCPVKGAGKFDFSNSFGAPRHGGRRHAGNDIFARRGTPVVASVDGTLRVIRGALTGIGYELTGDDGTTYFGAHMDDVAVGEGRVARGQVVGTVGTTGNANGTPPHLHFEVRPGHGAPVDPYGLLRAWCA